VLTPEIDTDIPLADYPPTFADLRERVDAAFAALTEMQADVVVTDEDEVLARQVLTGARKPTEVALSSPGTVVHIKAILSEYDKAVVESAAQIRTFVTNKLILESENADPRIRMRALELLGKISDVGLFTEKTEVTMRHRPTAELEQLLRERLARTLNADEVETPHSNVPNVSVVTDVDQIFGSNADSGRN
jgi:hypothetical protein